MALLLSSCSGPGVGPPSPEVSLTPARIDSAAQQVAGERTLARFTQGASVQDSAVTASTVATTDPAFADDVERLSRNIYQLDELGWRVTERRSGLNEARQRVLGQQAWTAQTVVTWKMAGDRYPSQHKIWVTFTPEDEANPSGNQQIAGIADGPVGESAKPLWWVEAITVKVRGKVTVMAGSRADANEWLADATSALNNVDRASLGSAAKSWDSRLSLVVPSNDRLVEAVLGVGRGTYGDIAASTVPDSIARDSKEVPLRIVMSPKTNSNRDLDLVVLTHELVHVATDSAHSAAPVWFVEGIAEEVAYSSYPWAAEAQQAALRDNLKKKLGSAPAKLPSDADYEPGAPDLAESYLRGWLAVHELTRLLGGLGMAEFYADASEDGEIEQSGVTDGYLAQRVDKNIQTIARGATIR